MSQNRVQPCGSCQSGLVFCGFSVLSAAYQAIEEDPSSMLIHHLRQGILLPCLIICLG